ncbi:MAG: hypothetical protein R2751_18925 [Bacteroidales bacterium]
MKAGSWNLDDPGVKPSAYSLPVRPLPFAEGTDTLGGRLYDFGRETFGFVEIS